MHTYILLSYTINHRSPTVNRKIMDNILMKAIVLYYIY